MKLTILGMNGPYPSASGACSGYLLEHEQTRVLFDCGPGILNRVVKLGFETISTLVLTHLHWDHCSDALAMNYALAAREVQIPLYLPNGPDNVRVHFNEWGGLPPVTIDGSLRVKVGEMELSFYSMRHTVPCYGVRVECAGKVFAYTGDTNTCDELQPLLSGADIALIDSCFLGSQWKIHLPHLSARLAAHAASKAGVKKAVLTHLPVGGNYPLLLEQAREVYDHCVLAKTGASLEI